MNETEARQKSMEKVELWALTPWRQRLAMFAKLPMAFIAGMRIVELTPKSSKVSVPYRWMNSNPFRSTFWAVLGMAAEGASGILAVLHTVGRNPSVAMLVAGCTARFRKKAVGLTTFHCEDGDKIREGIEKAIATGEGVEVDCVSRGYDSEGQLIAEFTFTWSFKQRQK